MSDSPVHAGSSILEFLAAGGIGAGLLQVFNTWVSKRKSPEDAAAGLIELALKASGSSVEQLLRRLGEAEGRIEELTAQHNECESRCTELNGQVAQQAQRIDSLLRQLREPGATMPGGVLSGAVFELADGGVTALATGPGPSDSKK